MDVQVESRATIEKQITQITRTKSFNVKVNGARDAVKESPPRRPISVAVQEKVFVVLNLFPAQTIWTMTSEIVPRSMFTKVTEFNS